MHKYKFRTTLLITLATFVGGQDVLAQARKTKAAAPAQSQAQKKKTTRTATTL